MKPLDTEDREWMAAEERHIARQAVKSAQAKAKRKEIKRQEEQGPKLPKPCGCDIPMRNYDEDGSPYCFRCTRGLAA